MDWSRAASSKFFDTQVPSVSTEELVLPCHARCVLSRQRCNGHSLQLNSYLTRISRSENLSCSSSGHLTKSSFISFCIVQFRALCAACSLAKFSLSKTYNKGPGEFSGFYILQSSAILPSLERDRESIITTLL